MFYFNPAVGDVGDDIGWALDFDRRLRERGRRRGRNPWPRRGSGGSRSPRLPSPLATRCVLLACTVGNGGPDCVATRAVVLVPEGIGIGIVNRPGRVGLSVPIVQND